MRCCARGLMDKEIADELGLSISTVKTHLSRILLKWDCRRRQDLFRQHFLAEIEAGEVGFPVPILFIGPDGSRRIAA